MLGVTRIDIHVDVSIINFGTERLSAVCARELFSCAVTGVFHGNIEQEKRRIEQRFQRLRGEKMKAVMSNLSPQERARIDDMIDKQTREMLLLIDQKVSVVNIRPT